MKISGIIYQSEWERDGESVSFREEVIVSRFETKDEDYFDRNTTQDTTAVIPGLKEGEDHPAVLRKSVSVFDTPSQRVIKSDSSKQKRDRKLKRPSLIDSNTFRLGAKIALPKRKRFKPMRKLFGLLLFVPKKSLKFFKTRRFLGFPLRVVDRIFKKISKELKKLLRLLRVGKIFRSARRVVGFMTRNILKGLRKLSRIPRTLRLRKIFHSLTQIITGGLKGFSKILKQTLKIFRVFKVVNKDRTAKVLKTSSKYSKKSGKAMFKSTKWLTIKTLKLIPPTASLTYRGAKKIKSNDMLLRLVIATIAGIIFIGAVFFSTG